ncbi:MAG TPA: hypothetical protein VKT52_13580 [Ktedonobacterales bacterium]|nr:hypothetical protein [Ktedonobacterales bacterium]
MPRLQYGGDSPEMMHSAARALVAVVPHAHYRTLAGQTHGVALDVLAPVRAGFFLG